MIFNGHKLNSGKFSEFNWKLFFNIFSIESDPSPENSKSLLRHSFTFDDGHADLIQINELFKKYSNSKFLIFIAPQLIDDFELGFYSSVRSALCDRTAVLLSWEQISYLKSEGHSIGLHGLDHKSFSDMNIQEQVDQHEKSLELMEQRMGIKPDEFAYPFGRLEQPQLSSSVKLAEKYFKNIYFSDNRFCVGKEGSVINRRHAEFDSHLFKNYLKAIIRLKSQSLYV